MKLKKLLLSGYWLTDILIQDMVLALGSRVFWTNENSLYRKHKTFPRINHFLKWLGLQEQQSYTYLNL